MRHYARFSQIRSQMSTNTSACFCLLPKENLYQIDNATGKLIEYQSSNESNTSFNVVSVMSTSTAIGAQFGIIKGLFVYRDANFAIIESLSAQFIALMVLWKLPIVVIAVELYIHWLKYQDHF